MAFADAVASLLLGLGVVVDAGNALALWRNLRRRRAGDDRHVSFVPLLAQMFASGAAFATTLSSSPDWSTTACWAVALCDVSLPVLLMSLPRRLRSITTRRD